MKKIILLFAGLAFLTFKNQAQTVTDSDGNVYNTVTIGTQVWMKENLKSGTYVAIHSGAQAVGTKYCQNLNGLNDASCPLGGLYEWPVMMNGSDSCNGTGAGQPACTTPVQGICPSGWHVPSHYEWTLLEKNAGTNPGAFPYDETTTTWLGTDEGGNLKQTGTINWTTPNTGATDSKGFTALPGGYSSAGSFYNAAKNGSWWSSTESGTNAWGRNLTYMMPSVYRDTPAKAYGCSVRCVKDVMAVQINDNSTDKQIQIYPNPALDKVFINITKAQNFKMQIYNIVGECVLQGELNQVMNEIDVSDLSKGIYVIQLTGTYGIFQQKLIKE
ncbi:MAG: hypothetical protein A3F72_21785 [Bacteroidetes bacterium RIFCSPLOWO2_12_FULL_35_15]|nr:MAG: hypothetical protein A3F72_21785 [Bacteroidetes bacterium RIFCSPLOWO2_12_FULL_35_15]